MRAVVWNGPREIAVENVDDVQMVEPTDAILRLTSAAICGSDLHPYEGRAPAEPGTVFGHENLGVVEEVGPGVRTISRGDRVVLPFNISCGFCFNCTRGYSNACLVTNPHAHGGGYGYSGMGPHRGGQAEYVRVPYADYNALLLPGEAGDEHEDDFVLLADIFPTGYHATEQAHVRPGDTVAIFGAGPVGLLAALSARLKGAAEIYVVDAVDDRLRLAEQVDGVVAVDLREGDPVEQIIDLREPHRRGVQDLRGDAGEKMPGVMCTIDAIGYEAWDREAVGERQNPTQLLDQLVRVTNPTGHIGLIGVYFPEDPGGPDDDAQHGRFTISLGQAWNKGIAIEMGQCPVKQYNVYLRDLILQGLAKPSFIVSQRLPLDDAPEAYACFDERAAGYSKIVLKPSLVA